MDEKLVNVLITSFAGLGLPSTLCIPIKSSTTVRQLRLEVVHHLPLSLDDFCLSTISNKQIEDNGSSLTTFLSAEHDDLLSLRLSVPLYGGKGGFGSQLRAAGGRMSSKRKKTQGDANSSNRNLDGRRLRTINEAKALAEYLALKPEMERKEKEQRRKRWEQVVALAERREEEARNGVKGRVDGKWVEDKEEAGERARDAAKAAVLSGNYRDNLQASQRRNPHDLHSSEEDEPAASAGRESKPQPAPTPAPTPGASSASMRTYAGFDEDDEFMSDSEESEGSDQEMSAPEVCIGKGKGKA